MPASKGDDQAEMLDRGLYDVVEDPRVRVLMWFRSDLRSSDNTALHHAARDAARDNDGTIAVFVISPEEWSAHDVSPARLSLILRTLSELSRDLAELNIPLLIETAGHSRGVPALLLSLAQRERCQAIYFNREYEIDEHRRDDEVRRAFESAGLQVRAFTDQVVLAPDEVQKGGKPDGGYYTVFTPYKRAWMARAEDRAAELGGMGLVARPRKQRELGIAPSRAPALEQIKGLPDWCRGARPDDALWPPGEREAERRLRRFIEKRIRDYDHARDFPAEDGTSILSPYLAIGAISPRRCFAAALEAADEPGPKRNTKNTATRFERGPTGITTWMNELIWREFYIHVLAGYPRVCMGRAFQTETERLAWRYDEEALSRWKEGQTGYPIVDAGMRQMAATGWMHNRIRMITAMFLSKHLLLDWRLGERHFMRSLVDGFFASNNGGWQWAASTGTDAAPYFRIFNPWSQSQKFDPGGKYIRRWVPELESIDTKSLHEPPPLPPAIGDGLFGKDSRYPPPIVEHGPARKRAIEAFKALRR